MILLIAPYQEGFGVIMVDASSRGPVTASVGGLEETITLLEQEMVIDELLLGFFAHSGEGVEGSLEFSLKTGQSGLDFLFHLFVLGLG